MKPMKSKGLYLISAAVLGFIRVLLALDFKNHPFSTHGIISRLLLYLIDVLLLIIIFLVARLTKKKGGGSPLWMGALTGGIYGLIVPLGSFFEKIDASKFQGTTLTAQQIANAVKYANSPLVHLVGVLGNIIIFGVAGLVEGAIGGATAQRENPPSIN
jgi:hypothetical protein